MIALNPGDSIRGDASVASKVDYVLSGIVGVEVTHLASGQLASSEGTLFTAQAVGGAVTAICLVNTDSSARTLNIYHQPKGGTSRRIVPKDISLSAGYCMYANGVEIKVLDTSGNEQMSAIALDDTPVDGETQEAITSNWAYDHNAKTTGTHGVTGTILGTEDLEGTPTEDLATKAPTSEWAFDTEAKLDDCSFDDVSGSRSGDTEYQNGSKIRIAIVRFEDTGTTHWTVTGKVGAASGSTITIAEVDGDTDYNVDTGTITLVIPPSYYYEINTATNTTINEWVEFDLH